MNTGHSPVRASLGLSIRAHLLAIIVALIVANAVAGGVFATIEFSKARKTAAVDASFAARLARDAIVRSLADSKAAVSSAASSPSLVQALRTPQGCGLLGGGAGVFAAGHFDIVRSDGTDVCSSLVKKGAPPSASYAGQPWLKNALASEAATVSEPFDDGLTGTDAIAVSAPLRDGARTVGLFVDVLSLTKVGPALSQTYGGPRHMRFTLVDAGSRTILSSAERSSVAARPVTGTFFAGTKKSGTGLDGVERIYGTNPIEGTTWRLYAGIDTSRALAAARGALAHQAIVAVAALSLALVVLAIVDRRIGAPVRKLRLAIKRSSRMLHPEPLIPGGPSEVKELVSSFNEMVETRTRYEARLHQAERLESIGRLAGGIAHDFNNLLTAISSYGDLVDAEIRTPSDGAAGLSPAVRASVLDDIGQIQQATRRAADLTQSLLTFSRQGVTRPEVVNVNTIVADMEKLLRRTLGEQIELTTTCDPDLWEIKADKTQLEQILMNLVVNARDAMPQGGRLDIATGNVDIGDGDDHIELQPGWYVCLTVADSGVGMTREVVTHAFEPFYTTKPAGKGNGLGLATIHGIVAQAGGGVHLYSEPGLGTTFRIYLPQTIEAAERVREPVAPASGSGETILLVENEDSIRDPTERLLRRAGYEVLPATGPAEAIELAASNLVHLLLTDVVLPEMTGRDLADRMRALHSDAPVIFMSGYSPALISYRGILEPGAVLLEKPFTEATLLRAIREGLEARPSILT